MMDNMQNKRNIEKIREYQKKLNVTQSFFIFKKKPHVIMKNIMIDELGKFKTKIGI